MSAWIALIACGVTVVTCFASCCFTFLYMDTFFKALQAEKERQLYHSLNIDLENAMNKVSTFWAVMTKAHLVKFGGHVDVAMESLIGQIEAKIAELREASAEARALAGVPGQVRALFESLTVQALTKAPTKHGYYLVIQGFTVKPLHVFDQNGMTHYASGTLAYTSFGRWKDAEFMGIHPMNFVGPLSHVLNVKDLVIPQE